MATVRVERRLSAILAADLVGYSRLIELDEAATLAAIRQLRREVLDPLIAEHGGRIVKLMGDGAIVEFASVVDAVACAVAWQNEVPGSQKEALPDRRLSFRIGINLGDVVVEGDDLFGDGVNIAARLEALADPGGICISDTVERQLAGKSNFAFEDTGEHQLKNITRPVRVWRWVSEQLTGAPEDSLALPDRPSVAVLPFDNLSGQPDETYFSDGITEDIITGLARFRSLFVIARNSSFVFRGKSLDLKEIGRKLGVAFILEGSVRRAGNRVRITAQLIEAATGAHLWAERYDRSLDDIFAVQDEVAQQIVVTLVGRIESARLQQSLRKPTTSLAAYDCLLRGLAHFRDLGDDANQQALAMFRKAVALDDRYAVARSYVAFVPVAESGHASAPTEVIEAAFIEAKLALDLDPQESRCHRLLSVICLYRRDYNMADQHAQRAFDLNPNDPETMLHRGRVLAIRGRPEDALVCLEAACRFSPLRPSWYNAHFGIAFYSLRRFEEAAEAFKLLRERRGTWARARLAACYAQLGRIEEVKATVAYILRQEPDFSIAVFMSTSVLMERTEDRELVREGLVKAGLPD